MPSDPFLEEEYRVLTPEAFDFVLKNELKRAVRSQNFVTLLLVEPYFRDAPRGGDGERERLAREIAGLVSRDVRETDLLSQTEAARLSIVLLDTDFPSSARVVDRLMSRFEHYQFSRPIDIAIGAACCPTHATDAESLRRAAEERSIYPRRDAHNNASNTQ